MKRLSHIILGLHLSAVSSVAGHSSSIDETLPAIMQSFVTNGSKVAQMPDAHGMQSFLVTKGDNRQTMYVTPDGQAVIAGLMFDKDMKSITTTQLKTVLPQERAGFTDFEALFATTTGFLLGMKETPDMAVFADPLCPECARFWRAAAGPIAKGELTIYVIPIGVVNNHSAIETAAKLMSTDQPAISWLEFTRTKVLPQHHISYEDWVTIVTQNNRTFFDLGFSVTPSFGLPSEDGSLRLQNGIPNGMLQLLSR